MASASVARRASLDLPQNNNFTDEFRIMPSPLTIPVNFALSAKKRIEPRNGSIENDSQPESPVEPDGSAVELMEEWIFRLKKKYTSQLSQTEDEKQPEDFTQVMESPKQNKLRRENLQLGHSQTENSNLQNSTPRSPKHKSSKLKKVKLENASSGNAKSINRKRKELGYVELTPKIRKAKTAPPLTPAVDEAMSSLISQLDQTLKIKDKATTASRMVEVPSGYKLDLEVGPDEFYKMREECKFLDKRKRAAGLLPMSTKRYQRYGFRPEELLSAGALYSPNARSSNLTNDLHPFFHRRRFDDTPDIIYDQLVPGLRLATMFLTQPVCCQYWVTLAQGQRTHDVAMSKKLGRKCLRIPENVPLTMKNAREVIEYIKKLDEASIIHFSFRKDLYLNRPKDVLARTRPVCDVDFEIPEGLAFRPKKSHVCLHHDFYTAAHKLSKLVHPDPALILRFNFFLACNILHEMAHAINVAHCYSQQTGGLGAGIDYNEPFLLDDTEAELGNTWEKQMFGGRVAPINGRVDTSHGLSICDWPYVGLPKDVPPIVGLPSSFRRGSLVYTAMDNKQHIWRSIPMTFVEYIQQMSTWEQEFDLATDTSQFHIKRTGAVSITMNRFTTMPWAEELRLVVEQLARPFARSADDDGDEPPTKKRETGTGKAVRTDIFGRMVVDREVESQEDVKGIKDNAPAFKAPGLQEIKTKHRGRQSRHLKMVRARNGERRRRQAEAEKRNAGPH